MIRPAHRGSAFRRHRRLALGSALFVAMATAVVAWGIPNEYESSVDVVVRIVPDAEGASTPRFATHLATAWLLSRPRVRALLDAEGRDPGDRPARDEDERVDHFRSRVHVERIVREKTGDRVLSFVKYEPDRLRLSYRSRSADRAERVVEALAWTGPESEELFEELRVLGPASPAREITSGRRWAVLATGGACALLAGLVTPLLAARWQR